MRINASCLHLGMWKLCFSSVGSEGCCLILCKGGRIELARLDSASGTQLFNWLSTTGHQFANQKDNLFGIGTDGSITNFRPVAKKKKNRQKHIHSLSSQVL